MPIHEYMGRYLHTNGQRAYTYHMQHKTYNHTDADTCQTWIGHNARRHAVMQTHANNTYDRDTTSCTCVSQRAAHAYTACMIRKHMQHVTCRICRACASHPCMRISMSTICIRNSCCRMIVLPILCICSWHACALCVCVCVVLCCAHHGIASMHPADHYVAHRMPIHRYS